MKHQSDEKQERAKRTGPRRRRLKVARSTNGSHRLARLAELDQRLLRRVVRHRNTRITFAFQSLCRLLDIDVAFVWIGTLMVMGAYDMAERCAAAMIGASIVALIVKRVVKRARPAIEFHIGVPPDQFSFPSGHTAAAVALAIVLVPTFAAPWLALFAIAVGYARLYLGVHYPLDVLAGSAVGLFVGSISSMLFV